MNRAYRAAWVFLMLSALAFVCGPTLGLAETPGEIKRLMWNQPVDVKGSDVSLTLDPRNAGPVD